MKVLLQLLKMWRFVNILLGIFRLLVYLSSVSTSTASLRPACYPVTSGICSDSSNVISLDLASSVSSEKFSSIISKREILKTERDREENDVLPWRYNVTTYPSFADDKSERDALSSLNAFHPLISTKCSKFIKLFLCSVHFPVCTSKGIVPPCRELCETVKDDCKKVAEMFSIEWPERLHCDYFPSFDLTKKHGRSSEYQVSQDKTLLISRRTSILWIEALLTDGNVCIPPSENDVIVQTLRRLEKIEKREKQIKPLHNFVDFSMDCPAEMRTTHGHHGYEFMGLPKCAAPCPNIYLDDDQLSSVRYFIFVLAIVCVLVTSFTLLTFFIDSKRFRYPERPIVFYAFSYLIVSVVFLLGFFLGESVACNSKVVNSNNEIVQGFVVVEGATNRLCSIIFMILYYFSMSGTAWWAILTTTWLLAAGFSWGSEAIERRRPYYHVIAWGLPAVQTFIAFISNKIEGDNIAGVCFVGLYDTDAQRYLLLVPMCAYLFIGISNLFIGFISLNQVRKKLDGDAENRQKLAKFMIRIGVFSILYILPQIALIAVYMVEDTKRALWEITWFSRSCSDYGVPCPVITHPVQMVAAESALNQDSQHPGVFLFYIKYTMILILALPPLFWVASHKTMKSWRNVLVRKELLKRQVLNPTQCRLLDDSNGPHARDLQAKLEEKLNPSDSIFCEMRNADLHGSSASVAALFVSTKRLLNENISPRLENCTSYESTEYDTSATDSEIQRDVYHESLNNKDVHLTSRKVV